MRTVVIAWLGLFAACVFHPPSSQEGAPSDAESPTDAESTSDAESPTDADSSIDRDADPIEDAASPCPGTRPTGPFCDPADPDLRACFTFDDFFVDGSNVLNIRDGSSFGNVGLVQSGSVALGRDGRSLTLDGTGQMRIALDASLNLARLTVEAWVRADALPLSGARAGVVDKNGSWGLFWESDGTLHCGLGNLSARSGAAPADVWLHIACTYDGTTLTAHQDGVSVDDASGGVAIGTGSADPLAVGANSPSGDRLVGQIDSLRIFNVVRSNEAICWDANP